MYIYNAIKVLPNNFEEYRNELVPAYRDLYGKIAAQAYATALPDNFVRNISHDHVIAIAAFSRERALGIIVASMNGNQARIEFIHLLHGAENEGIEARLIEEVVQALRIRGAVSILVETIPFCAVDIDGPLAGLGFSSVERTLMRAELDSVVPHRHSGHSEICTNMDDPALATLLQTSFARDAAEKVTKSLGTIESTAGVLKNYERGLYGPVRPEWSRIVRAKGKIAGIALGNALASDTGFIFQIAVHPDNWGQGYGGLLMHDLLALFRVAGMDHVMLGVTQSTPAHDWYKRMAFRDHRHVTVYGWHKDTVHSSR
ncbi:MAG: GNAT family N-acetyltransferase [Candidatus Hydrogenedentota bacterium]